MEEYQITASQMEADRRNKVILDLRKKQDFQFGSCPGAVNLWWEKLEQTLEEEGIETLQIPRNLPVYLLCYTGETSDEYAQYFRKCGYEAYSIAGGYRSYLRWLFEKEME